MEHDKYLKKVLKDLHKMISYKNEKYGNSIFRTIMVRGDDGIHALDTEARVQLRIKEKLERVMNLEDIEDRIEEYKDIAGYAILLLVWYETLKEAEGWGL